MKEIASAMPSPSIVANSMTSASRDRVCPSMRDACVALATRTAPNADSARHSASSTLSVSRQARKRVFRFKMITSVMLEGIRK